MLEPRRPPAAGRAAVAGRPRGRRDGRAAARPPRRRRAVGRAVPVGARAAADGAVARGLRLRVAVHGARRGPAGVAVPRRRADRPGDAPAAAADLRHGDRGRRPVLEDRAAAPGLDRLHGRAEVHLLGHARAVRLLRDRAHARRADDPGQDAGAAGRGVHGGARLRPRRRRDADHGLAEPARPRRDLHLALRGGDQGGVRAADPGPVRAAGRPAGARRGRAGGRRRGRHPLRDVRPRRCWRGSRRARRSAASRATSGRGSAPSTCSAAAA